MAQKEIDYISVAIRILLCVLLHYSWFFTTKR